MTLSASNAEAFAAETPDPGMIEIRPLAASAACFNPDTLCYEALWKGGFVKFSSVRHGFLHGLLIDGTALPRPAGTKPAKPFVYHGFIRHGRRVLFSYSIDGVKMLDAPWVEKGKFTRQVAPADKHPLAKLIRGGEAQWPQVMLKGTMIRSPFVSAVTSAPVSTISPMNSWPMMSPCFIMGMKPS